MALASFSICPSSLRCSLSSFSAWDVVRAAALASASAAAAVDLASARRSERDLSASASSPVPRPRRMPSSSRSARAAAVPSSSTRARSAPTEASRLSVSLSFFAVLLSRSAICFSTLLTSLASPACASFLLVHPEVSRTRSLESSSTSSESTLISPPMRASFSAEMAFISSSFSSMAPASSTAAALSSSTRSASSSLLPAAPACTSSAWVNSHAITKRRRRSRFCVAAAHFWYSPRSLRSFSRAGRISSLRTLSISSTLLCFFSSVLRAPSFLFSYMRVPAASSSMPRISGGFMLSTLVMRPCMMRKCGLLTLSCTEWKRFCTRLG
mmetsp:Transcript_18202/g.58871  ORF Transcript_18202/g.58871 Transcript_18202/m.58871 type:complete len:326 (-) Transcript_18202:133-1110(-)